MVGTLPEPGLVVIRINNTVGTDAPEPLAVYPVDKVRFDILKSSDSMIIASSCRRSAPMH